jgi:hypothetical protein
MVGAFAFAVFAIASMAQLVVGSLLDRFGARPVFMGAAAVQLVFFGLMAGSREAWALVIALGFMLGAFGQIPINDFMIGKMASGAARARLRHPLRGGFTALAALPLIAFVYERWGFDTLFCMLSAAASQFSCSCPCRPAAGAGGAGIALAAGQSIERPCESVHATGVPLTETKAAGSPRRATTRNVENIGVFIQIQCQPHRPFREACRSA